AVRRLRAGVAGGHRAGAVVPAAAGSRRHPGSAHRVSIASLEAVGAAPWDAFVDAQPGGGPYHLSAWAEILGRSLRAVPQYLAARDGGGEVVGALPLLYHRGLARGRWLRSLPLSLPAGPLV